jgi:uncharacterized cofD-like protein
MRRFGHIKVVCLGGGTGLSTVLSGLKHLSIHSPYSPNGHTLRLRNIAAVVTVSDDGGSSGRLRDQFQTPSPGDIRNCLVALASDESLMTQLFRYRFPDGELRRHSLGNLLLTALTDITGDFLQAVKLSSQVLAIEGQILPSTGENVTLRAVLSDGSAIWGETNISRASRPIDRISLTPEDCRPLPETLTAVEQADIITIGPGSLFTSLIPNLVVPGVVKAIERSQALKIHVVNLMTQPRETLGYSATDHIRAFDRHTATPRLFDHVLLNSEPISPRMLAKYREEGAAPVKGDIEEIQRMGITPHEFPMLHEGDVVRHDSVRLAEAILGIFDKEQAK